MTDQYQTRIRQSRMETISLTRSEDYRTWYPERKTRGKLRSLLKLKRRRMPPPPGVNWQKRGPCSKHPLGTRSWTLTAPPVHGTSRPIPVEALKGATWEEFGLDAIARR